MLHILAKRQAALLTAFASSNVLLAFDFDGTLAAIASRPDAVKMRPRTRRLLAAVALRYPAVVISGRSRADLVRRVGSVPVWHLAGNHGLEPWGKEDCNAAEVRRWLRLLRRELAAFPGVMVEDKKYSVTVHYRHSRDRRGALMALKRVVRDLRGVRLIGGRLAMSVVPSGTPGKGDAVERARQLLVCDTTVYVGDDETDEDVFARATHGKLLAVRVGRSRVTRAPYCLRHQREVDDLLHRLLVLRPLRPNGHRR